MVLSYQLRYRFLRLLALAAALTSIAAAATFGRVVPIGGHAADLALDEGRNVLYIANFTASRVDVMSLADNTVTRSINVAPYPNAIAMSMNGRYLVVTHYASSKGAPLSTPGQDALTIIDLTNNQKRTFGLSSGPVGVAFGIDNMALVLTQDEFLLLDPASGRTNVLDTVDNVESQPLPVPLATSPLDITAAALTATADGRHILGIAGTTPDAGDKSVLVRFSYNVGTRQITANQGLTSAPSLGPRAIAASRDGSYYMSGWALLGCGSGFLGDCTAAGPLLAQWPNASGELNVGSVAIRSSKSLIYAQITSPAVAGKPIPPNLMVLDADNLAVRERIQIPENLAGRSVFNSDESVLYSVSDSGVSIFSMPALEKAPRVTATAEDITFRGNFCSSNTLTQQFDVVDPSGSATPFQICVAGSSTCSVSGVSITPSSGVTPARVKITIDSTYSRTMIGTKALQFEIRSAQAVNMPPPPPGTTPETDYQANVRSRFRVLINNRVPENRGVVVNVSGELTDILADPARDQVYVLRRDKNQVQVYEASSYKLIATLRTGNTPTQMAITFDRNNLLIGHDNSQLAYRYDLNTLKMLAPIVFPLGHYPRSIAASSNGILAASRVAGPIHTIDRIDLLTSTAKTLPSLGPYKNDINVDTTLVAAPNGATIFAAMPDGNVMLYSASADSFTISRKDFTELKGSLSASSFGYYTVDRYLLNESLVPLGELAASADTLTGFAFVDDGGISTTVSSGGSGYIQRLTAGDGTELPIGLVEAPLTPTAYPFGRSLVLLASRSAVIQLTTSGFTVLPWNFDAASAPPVLQKVVSAADLTSPVASGGLAAVLGTGLSPTTLATTDAPLPTILADSCLTLNGLAIPMQFVSPTRINAQMPIAIDGKAEMVLHTPTGVSDTLYVTIQQTAPSVFRSGTAGPQTDIATVFRAANGDLVTVSNPVHLNDRLTIYLTGMGRTWPEVEDGMAAPADPLSATVVQPRVTLGSLSLPVEYAGLTPGSVGVYQVNVIVPFKGVPTGFDIPLIVTQGGSSATVLVRVVN
jgi:uncharacterized protein (TIGR03437 family)